MIFLLTTVPAVLLIPPPAPAVSQHTMVQFNYQMSPIFSSGWENSKTFICQRFREGCKKNKRSSVNVLTAIGAIILVVIIPTRLLPEITFCAEINFVKVFVAKSCWKWPALATWHRLTLIHKEWKAEKGGLSYI